MADIVGRLVELLGSHNVLVGDAVGEDLRHDECLTVAPVRPKAVARPASTDEVSAVLRACDELRVPVTARGSATGMSGAATPEPDGVVVCFDRMDAIVEIDTANQVAVVQPGVTLAQLDAAVAPHGLVYPVFPGEDGASLGGNVGTNAGGMRAVKYGVTRHHVLGVEAVLASGEVIRCGGKMAKVSSSYDLTQLLIGSEGTLALVTEVTCKLAPRPEHQATLLAPFPTLDHVGDAVTPLLASGVGPMVLEYVDAVAMAGMVGAAELDLGVPPAVRDQALAYLVVVLEGHHETRVAEDVETAAAFLDAAGALDVYVLPDGAGHELIRARERVFFAAKANGADDILDVVVPRAAIPGYLAAVADIATRHGAFVPGCGHVGDGNVHLSIFQPDPVARHEALREIFELGASLGGAVSGEHGLGRAKQEYFLALEDPAKVALLRRIKEAFDPHRILSPSTSL